MEIITNFIDLFIHLDDHINTVIQNYGYWTYLILFIIIFCETGLVVTPILPGDSLLFAIGALSVSGPLKPLYLMVLLSIAAILGDTVNYRIGKILAPKILANEKIPLIKREHIEKTHKFYEKYGPKTIILARFIPIIRTFAPFLAGVGTMSYSKFLTYNVIGGILWVVVGILSGYYFGNLPFVSENFSLVVLAIVVISLLPAVYEFWKHQVEKKSQTTRHKSSV